VKPPYRILILLVLLAACGALGYWLTVAARGRGGPPGNEVSSVAPGAGAPEAVVTSPVIKHSERGKLAWKIYLDEVELQSGGSTVGAHNLREGIVYDAAGKPAIRVTAKRVVGDATQKNFEMTGEVVVTSPKGVVISTEVVSWINDQQLIRCPGPVIMRVKGRVFTASALDYQVNSDIVQCPDQVRMYSGNNRVVGKSLTYNLKTGIVDITGGVQVVLNPQEAKKILKELRNP